MGWRKYFATTETLIPEVSNEDRVGDFLILAGGHAQRICTGRFQVRHPRCVEYVKM